MEISESQTFANSLEQEHLTRHTVFESNSWCGWAKTLSTLPASANVTNPNPLKEKKKHTDQNIIKTSHGNNVIQ